MMTTDRPARYHCHAVRVDVTGCYESSYLECIGVAKVYDVYLYDPRHMVHVCELTPSYELWYAGCDYETADPDHMLDDDEHDKLVHANVPDEPVTYIHRITGDDESFDWMDAEDYDAEYGDDDEDDPHRAFMQDMVEAYSANPIW